MAASVMQRRVSALECGSGLLTIGDLLDSLDGAPLPYGRKCDPRLLAGLEGLGNVA